MKRDNAEGYAYTYPNNAGQQPASSVESFKVRAAQFQSLTLF
jgi:hypothetical protein